MVISECGDSRRQIAYFGDTVNVTARLQEHAKEAGRALLYRRPPKALTARPGSSRHGAWAGSVRGRAATVEVFAIERGLQSWASRTVLGKHR